MAAIRISPGIYEVNGKRVNATSAAQAEKMAGGGNKPQQQGGGRQQGQQPFQQSNKQIVDPKTNYNNPNQAIEAERDVADYSAQQQINYGNANQVGPAGSRTYTRNPDGTYTQTDQLSGGQQQIFDQDQSISQRGRELGLQRLGGDMYNQDFNPNMPESFVPQDQGAARQKYFDSAYNLAIGNTERNYGQDKEELRQQLYNRGMSLEEINKHPEMQQLEDRYQSTRDQATNQAVMNSGSEYQRDFGIQEQQRANRFNEAMNTRNQNLSEINNLSGIGAGFQNPNFQGFQGATYNMTSPNAINTNIQDINLKKKQLNAAINQAGRGGGGGAQPATQPQSPFVTG